MLTLNDGRDELWQWDTGRTLAVDADCSQVHFSNKVFGRSSDIDVIDGVAVVPDTLLQTDKDLNVWAFVGTAENGYTKISKTFKVNRRNKPADYVFTPPDQTSLEEIKEKIEYLESIQDPDAIKNAVDDYLANNPIMVKETDPTVPEWAKQPTPPDVKIPDKLPNPHSITFTGAVDASYDGSNPVEIKIPDSGGNVDQASIEPADDDIPKVFFSGDISGMSKDNEKVLQFAYKSKTAKFDGYVKMKWQGNSTIKFPKKNFTIKMFTDEPCESKLKKAFKDWGYEKNKYVLKADYVDHTHARNVVTANLWTEMVASRPDFDSLPEGMKNAPGHGAIDGFPIKLYMNGVYEGVYTWTIGKDDWMFGMDEDAVNNAVLCAEVNNNGVTSTTNENVLSCEFRGNAKIDGSDWDLEFPDTLDDGIKTSFNNLINCVKDTDNDTFIATVGNYLDLTSAFDYYILAYLSANVDGLGKNLIMMTYDGVKWFCSAYDMDNIWGSRGTASFVSATLPCPGGYYETNNLLWKRIESCFSSELYARYLEVRKKVLSFENVIDKFERFCDLIGTELYAEDVEIYPEIPYPSENNLKQIRSFFTARAKYVDSCFAEISQGYVPCTGITLSASELAFTGEGTKTLTATVTPSNCDDIVTWESDNKSVATVVNGVVTAIANGSAIITARCGSHSASCSVSVSGFAVVIPCTGISLSASELTFTAEGSQTLIATVTPDGCTDPITWESDDSTIATVSGGVVTAVDNGTATITAKCGSHSASCVVNVSGISSNILEGVTWSVGEIKEIDGTDYDNATAARRTDYFDVSGYAGTVAKTVCSKTQYSRIVFYDENHAFLGKNAIGYCVIPKNAKYARLSIYNGNGVEVSMYGGKPNLWTTEEILDNGYIDTSFRTDSTKSHIKVKAVNGRTLACKGCWNACLIDADGNDYGHTQIASAGYHEMVCDENAAYAAFTANDTAVSGGTAHANWFKHLGTSVITVA